MCGHTSGGQRCLCFLSRKRDCELVLSCADETEGTGPQSNRTIWTYAEYAPESERERRTQTFVILSGAGKHGRSRRTSNFLWVPVRSRDEQLRDCEAIICAAVFPMLRTAAAQGSGNLRALQAFIGQSDGDWRLASDALTTLLK